MTADMEGNKKLRPIVTKFLTGRNLMLHLLLYHNLVLKYLKLIIQLILSLKRFHEAL